MSHHDPRDAPTSGPRTRSEQQQLSAALVRTAVINGVILGAVILAVYVLEVVDPERGVWLVVAAALVCGVHVSIVVTASSRRRQRAAQGRSAGVGGPTDGSQPYRPEPYGARASDAQGGGVPTEGYPYGAVDAAAAPGRASSGHQDRRGDAAPGGTAAFQMTVQDVFSITGRGTVVTGVVEHGGVDVGQHVTLVRGGIGVQETVVDGVEMFRKRVTQAVAGENVGLLLRGLVREDVEVGDVLRG